MTEIQRNPKGQITPGSGAALSATSPRRLGTGALAKIKALVEPEREAIVANLVAIAKGSSKEAVRAGAVVLGYLAAPAKPQSELINIPAMAEATTLGGMVRAVLAALAKGEVSAEAARATLQTIDTAGRIKKYAELEAQLRQIQEHLGIRPRAEASLPPVPVTEVEIVDTAERAAESLV